MRKILLLFAVMLCVGFSVNTQILGMGNMKSLFKTDDGGHIIISSEYIDTFVNGNYSNIKGEVLSLRYDEGWENISVPGLQCGNKSYCHETLADGSIALFFTGTVLMSQSPYLTIVILTHGKAYLVFNKRMVINNVVRNNGDLLFNLQENVVEWIDENTPADDAVLHTISVKEGLMCFE